MPVQAFYDHLDAVIEQAYLQGVSASIPGIVQRPWNIPPLRPGYETDIQDPAFFTVACDRHYLNDMAVAAYQTGNEANAGRLGTVMVAKKAMDYQAAYERALHARHASAVRCRAWAMARRTGHGSKTYGVFGVVRNELDQLRDAATAAPNTPTSFSADGTVQ